MQSPFNLAFSYCLSLCSNNRSIAFFVRQLRLAHFIFRGVVMDFEKIERERDMFKKMYFLLGARVSEVIEICNDPIIKQKLIDAHLETEEIYISEND